MDDGNIRRVNCWDLDKTLLLANGPHAETVDLMFPEVEDKELLRETYFAGFKLGNSFREWDRMIKIFSEGQTQYVDPLVYKTEFVDNEGNRKIIDESGHKEGIHERANVMLQHFGKAAAGWMEKKYKEDPEYFQRDKFVIGPLFQLLKAKQFLGEANVFMIANQEDFAKALVKYSGLAEHGLALATDETMVGGGKEVAIPKLIEELKLKYGLETADDRIVVIGDSITGDIGSGHKAGQNDPAKKFEGLLVVNGEQELRNFVDSALTPDNKELKDILESVDVTLIDYANTPRREHSKAEYKLGRRTSMSNKT